MPFGSNFVAGAEEDKLSSTRKSLNEQAEDTTESSSSPVSVSQQAPEKNTVATASTPQETRSNRFNRFNRSTQPQAVTPEAVSQTTQKETASVAQPQPTQAVQKQTVQQNVNVSSAVVSAKPSSPVKQTPFSKKDLSALSRLKDDENDGDVTPDMYIDVVRSAATDSDDDVEELVVPEENEAYAPSKQHVLALRARRMVQEVGEFQKWSLDQIASMERMALKDPQEVMEKLLPVYKKEIVPVRSAGVSSLEDARKKHPDDVVFLLVKGDKNKIKVTGKGSGQDLLDGAMLESLQSNSTPFDKPVFVVPKLFEKPDTEENKTAVVKSPSP